MTEHLSPTRKCKRKQFPLTGPSLNIPPHEISNYPDFFLFLPLPFGLLLAVLLFCANEMSGDKNEEHFFKANNKHSAWDINQIRRPQAGAIFFIGVWPPHMLLKEIRIKNKE